MLSYRHSFHAGNFADVLKHLVLVNILQYLGQKDKPLCYIDTHAAAGAYALDSDAALKTREYENGIGALWQQANLPPSVANYVQLVRNFNAGGALVNYPGSPWFAQQVLRPNDRLFLYELHKSEFELLKENMRGDRRVHVKCEDGFVGSVALMPPQERRGLVLIDPPYEVKKDYQTVVQSLVRALRRFSMGVYALWYPVVDRYRINDLIVALKNSGIRNVQLYELGLEPDSDRFGMTASGMVVINPPWVMMEEMATALPFLANCLSERGHYRIEQLVPE